MGSISAVYDTTAMAPLPVAPLRDKIVEKIRENRVTLIVGDTGCGKSSQVPQFLLEENMEPILCTQPRRFAVVAIARMVAKFRNCEVGGDVGYHIGHSNVSDITSKRSRIVFKTSGVLLEQMRDKGVAALKYKVIILDEVHERSVESDLVLACVKQFMSKNNDLRLVLMSATADIARYRDYFKDLGRGERVEVIAIPSTSKQTMFQRKVSYLEEVVEFLGMDSESLLDRYCSGANPVSADADMKNEVHSLIHKLVMHIHDNEPDIEKSILIFLPTYYALEQQWVQLKSFDKLFKVHILHRSIDTDQALLAMRILKSHRKVILATNIAESSVTIPGVAFVIDSCRSLQVFWDSNRKKDSAELVWVSKSQAEQRKGRTGRTCDGHIYRLVTRTFYNNLRDHEEPAILRLSLREQVLRICCAESRAISEPKVMLQKVLDPPYPQVVEDAFNLLVHVHALDKPLSNRGRYEPTFYGRLLDSLPLSFDASVLALKFGEAGMLREGVLISILMDIQPSPILQPFGQQILFTRYLDNYFEVESVDALQTGKKETLFMANLCAFQFWQRVFKDKHRLERLKQIVKVDESPISVSLIPKLEEEWCLAHNLVQSSLNNIAEIYEDILSAMHRFRPDFFSTNELPSYYEPYEFQHTCLLQCNLIEEMDALKLVDGNNDPDRETRKCTATPFVSSNHFKATAVAEKLKMVVREIRLQYTEDNPRSQVETEDVIVPKDAHPALCTFFLKGLCNRGYQCCFSHSLQAKRPLCKFFLTYQGCRYGESCTFLHDYGPRLPSITSSGCFQVDEVASAYTFLQLLPAASDDCVLILNDKDLCFSSHLSDHYDASKIVTVTPHPHSFLSSASLNGARILRNMNDPCHCILETKGEISIPWEKVKCVLWFPETEVNEASIEQRMLQSLFEFLGIRILAETLYTVRVILTMNNIRFAQLKVEWLARECFFFLTQSFAFDESSFGKIPESNAPTRSMQASLATSYVFDMHPPTDIQFGNYAGALHKGLYSRP